MLIANAKKGDMSFIPGVIFVIQQQGKSKIIFLTLSKCQERMNRTTAKGQKEIMLTPPEHDVQHW